MHSRTPRLLFSGPFHADHHTRAIDALCARADAGARDIVDRDPSAGARRGAISDLVQRLSAV
jgi:hypothetical protein